MSRPKDLNGPSPWNMRIWDVDNNEWLGESDPDVLTYYGFDIRGGEVTEFQSMDWVYRQFANGRKFIWERSTGLRDKNGVEIYEGDIVKRVIQVVYSMPEAYYAEETTNKEREEMRPKRIEYPHEWARGSAVEWDDDAVGFQPFVHGCGLCGKGTPFGEEVVIIGNIHENPELLKEEEK